ncbi:hypothetical protein quinque_010477 [Culex quinquefasciatus]
MKLAALVTLLVLGTTYCFASDEEDVSGPKRTEAAEERFLDLSRKSRQLLGSGIGGYYPYSNGFGQGLGGYPYSYSNGLSGYSSVGGYPYATGGYGSGLYGNTGIYSNGLYGNAGLGGYSGGFNPLAGGYNTGLYNGFQQQQQQQLYNDPYNPIGSRGFFPGSPFYRRPF